MAEATPQDPEVMPPGQPRALVLSQQVTGLVRPMASVTELEQAYQAFTQFKNDFLKNVTGGVIEIGYGENRRPYVAKPGWVAAKTFFRIDTELLREEWKALPDGTMQFLCVVRARAKNGDFADAVGVADTAEDFYRKGTKLKDGEKVPEGVRAYDIRSQVWDNGRPSGEYEWRRYLPKSLSALVGFAQTRAQNRAISTVCGGGENSAEEMGDGDGGGSGAGKAAAARTSIPRGGKPAARPAPAPAPTTSTTAAGSTAPAPTTGGGGVPPWWKVGTELDADTEALDNKAETVQVRAVLRFAALDIPTSGSKKKSWPTFDRQPAWKGLSWLQLFKVCVKARMNGSQTPGDDPIEWILATPGQGAFGDRGANWLGETAAALDFMANRWLLEHAPADSPWRDSDAAMQLGATARGPRPDTSAAPKADPKAQAAADEAKKAGAAVQTGAEAGLGSDHDPNDSMCFCKDCIPF